MTLKSYLRIVRERWGLVVVGLGLGLAVAVLITVFTPRTYEASAQVLVSSNATSDPLAQYQAAAFAQAQVATYAEIVPSPAMLDDVKRSLNLDLSTAKLRSMIFADAPAQRSLVNIHVIDSEPSRAAAIANAAASAFLNAVRGYSTPTNSLTPSVKLDITSPATAPSQAASPNPTLNLVLGVILGLLGGLVLAVARDVLDTRIRSLEKLAAVTGKPAMGVVVDDADAKKTPVATRVEGHSQRAENFRQLRANLQFANVDAHPRVIAVTSSIPGEGKTMVALNLASTLAEAGFSVCLVDADLRRPTIAKLTGLPGAVGLTSVLIQQVELLDAIQNAGSGLFVLTSGPTPPNPAELLASTYVRDVIRSLLDRVDYIVIDTAPLLPVADGAEVAALADGTLFVARHGLTIEPQVKRSIAVLGRVAAPVIGVVLNRMPIKRGGQYGYAYYRYQSDRRPAPSKRKNQIEAEAEPKVESSA